MMNSPSKKDEHAVLAADFLRDLARLKGRAAPQQPVQVATSVLYPLSEAIAAEERRKEEAIRKALEEAAPGQYIPGHGVFIGMWQPEGLSQRFNVFAAIEDLTNEDGKKEVYTYFDTVKRIAELKGWHGHDGTSYANDKDLYKALHEGSYKGGWFIPPCELLEGTKANGPSAGRRGIIIQPDSLYTHKNTGDLSRTFHTVAGGGSRDCYLSSSEVSDGIGLGPDFIWQVGFRDGRKNPVHKNGTSLHCRPIRLELAS